MGKLKLPETSHLCNRNPKLLKLIMTRLDSLRDNLIKFHQNQICILKDYSVQMIRGLTW